MPYPPHVWLDGFSLQLWQVSKCLILRYLHKKHKGCCHLAFSYFMALRWHVDYFYWIFLLGPLSLRAASFSKLLIYFSRLSSLALWSDKQASVSVIRDLYESSLLWTTSRMELIGASEAFISAIMAARFLYSSAFNTDKDIDRSSSGVTTLAFLA